MNTAVTPFATQRPAAAFQTALGAHPQESLADGIGASYGVLHYKGKVWSLRYRGQSYVITRPDDGSPANAVDLIILRQAKGKSKSYYPKWDPNSSDGERPICASLDGVTPDADVQHRQAEVCAICPRNVWKLNAEGRNVRECTDYKRLAVMLLPSITQRLLGQPLVEPVFLRIPPASLNDLGVFGDRMNAMGWHYSTYITRVSFDPTSEYPKFKFEEVQALGDAEAPVVLEQRENPNSLRITGEDKITAIPGAARPLAITDASRVAAPQTATAAPPAQSAPAVQTVSSHSKVDTGFGAIGMNGPTVVTAAPAAPAADVGETVESDAALDEQIASILNP